MLFLLEAVYKVDKVFLDTFSAIFCPRNFEVNPQITKIIATNTRQAHGLYSLDLLNTLKLKTYSINRNLIFKVFPEHIENNSLNFTEVLNTADLVILNYRNSLIKSYISFKKASLSSRWASDSSLNYLEKIQWDITDYNKYVEGTITKFNKLQAACEKTLSTVILVSYDELHDSNITYNEKINILESKFLEKEKDFKWVFNNKPRFEKENYLINIEDNFLNPETFLRDQPFIRTTLITPQ